MAADFYLIKVVVWTPDNNWDLQEQATIAGQLFIQIRLSLIVVNITKVVARRK